MVKCNVMTSGRKTHIRPHKTQRAAEDKDAFKIPV